MSLLSPARWNGWECKFCGTTNVQLLWVVHRSCCEDGLGMTMFWNLKTWRKNPPSWPDTTRDKWENILGEPTQMSSRWIDGEILSMILRNMRITLYRIYHELISETAMFFCFFSICRPKEFIECVSHIRQLSWLLLGSLTHCALLQGSTSCMPIPLDAGSHIADHLIVILIGFPEQSKVWQKQTAFQWLNPGFVNLICNHLTGLFYFGLDLCPQTSVLHMCSLFHAFMFAQLWTIYCEQAAAAPSLLNQNQTEFSSSAILTGLEFWSRVTPSILQLMAHNKVVSAPRYDFPLGVCLS